jgi:nucleolar protein 53
MKKKHISKKSKSSWRKVDVKDVEDFLEEERFIEIIG